MRPIKKILVPIDFSPHAAEATAWAADLARRYDASLILVHVVQPVTLALPTVAFTPSATLAQGTPPRFSLGQQAS